jgi:BolA family transcriptional regulator, general stress-responsive regulator
MRTPRVHLQVLTFQERLTPCSAALTKAHRCRYCRTMDTRTRITEKLTAAFAPARLDVIDESHQHAGHAGSRPAGETHYRVHIVSDSFKGKSRIERHRMVNATLADELARGVHALAIQASAPGEPG